MEGKNVNLVAYSKLTDKVSARLICCFFNLSQGTWTKASFSIGHLYCTPHGRLRTSEGNKHCVPCVFICSIISFQGDKPLFVITYLFLNNKWWCHNGNIFTSNRNRTLAERSCLHWEIGFSNRGKRLWHSRFNLNTNCYQSVTREKNIQESYDLKFALASEPVFLQPSPPLILEPQI